MVSTSSTDGRARPRARGELPRSGAAVRRARAAPLAVVNVVRRSTGPRPGRPVRSGSINNAADDRVFHLARSIGGRDRGGGGDRRAEGYGPTDRPIVLVSRSGGVPDQLRGAEPGAVLMDRLRRRAPDRGARASQAGHVLVPGSHRVEPHSSCGASDGAGGPNATTCPKGARTSSGPRRPGRRRRADRDVRAAACSPVITRGSADGPPVDVPLSLRLLLEEDGTLLGRWFI